MVFPIPYALFQKKKKQRRSNPLGNHGTRTLRYRLLCSNFALCSEDANLLSAPIIRHEYDTPKVYRWKQRLLEFTFSMTHVIGEDNCVADALSRLCSSTTRLARKRNKTTVMLTPMTTRSSRKSAKTPERHAKSKAKAKVKKATVPPAVTVSKISSPKPHSVPKASTPRQTITPIEPDQAIEPQHEALIRQFHNDFTGHSNTFKRLQHAGHA
jgi:hypothetical protein